MLERFVVSAGLLTCCFGCHGGQRSPTTLLAERTFFGMCDASAAVALGGRSVVVADDEQNVLRVYDIDRGGSALFSVDLSQALGVPVKVRKDGSEVSRELDIEAAARLGDEAFFITSHGRDSHGRRRLERLKFFALRVGDAAPWPLSGAVYEGLLDDLSADPHLAAYGLREAAQLPAKAAGGLNIEGLAVRAEGGVWLGFRNPVPQGRALLVPLLNPGGLVRGARPLLGEPRLVDLGGRSVRALGYVRGSYLIAAGAFDGARAAALYRWDGGDRVEELRVPSLERYNPEALLAADGSDQLLLLSDDGTTLVDGVECKKLKDPTRRRFRGLWTKRVEGLVIHGAIQPFRSERFWRQP
jgi:hypothetical protein